jgi:hypothetical protein
MPPRQMHPQGRSPKPSQSPRNGTLRQTAVPGHFAHPRLRQLYGIVHFIIDFVNIHLYRQPKVTLRCCQLEFTKSRKYFNRKGFSPFRLSARSADRHTHGQVFFRLESATATAVTWSEAPIKRSATRAAKGSHRRARGRNHAAARPTPEFNGRLKGGTTGLSCGGKCAKQANRGIGLRKGRDFSSPAPVSGHRGGKDVRTNRRGAGLSDPFPADIHRAVKVRF